MSPSFNIGQEVRVRSFFPPGHCRTPAYCRGHKGEIVRICGEFHNPEQLAYGAPAPDKQTLYRVRFSRAELWPEDPSDRSHQVEIEIYEHWLEAL